MRVVTAGHGDDVVLIHGLPQDPGELAPLAEHLAQTRRVHRVELPGYGSAPAGPTSPGEVSLRLIGELRRRGVARPALVGVSVGFWRCVDLAVRWPEARPRILVGLGAIAGLDPAGRELYRASADAVASGADLSAAVIERFLSPGFAVRRPEVAAAVGRYFGAAPTAIVAAELRAFAEMGDAAPAIAEIGVPIALRVGALDRAAPPPTAHRWSPWPRTPS